MSENVYQAVITYGEYSDYMEMTLCVATSRAKALRLCRQYLVDYPNNSKPDYLFDGLEDPEIVIRKYPLDRLNPKYSKAIRETHFDDRFSDEIVLEDEVKQVITLMEGRK